MQIDSTLETPAHPASRPGSIGWGPIAVLLLCLIPSAATAWMLSDLPHLGSFHDDGLYLVSARSLVQDHDYRIASLPGEPWQTKYPPLYPLYLSIAWLLEPSYPSNLPWVTFLMWLWFPAFVFGAWRFFLSSGFGTWTAVAMAAACAILPRALLAANTLMSDVAFAALLLGCLLLHDRRPGAAGLLAGAAYLTRTAALPLLVAIPVALLLARRGGSAVRFLAAALPWAAGWHVWSALHRASGSDVVTIYYTDYLRYQLEVVPLPDLPAHVWNNIGLMTGQLASLLALDAGAAFPLALLRPVIAAACIAGVVRLVRRKQCLVYALFAAMYAAMLAVWYHVPAARLLIPILPLLLAGFWSEIAHVARLARQSEVKQRAVAIAAGAALAGLFLWNAASQYRTAGPSVFAAEREGRRELAVAYRWAADHTPAQSAFFAVNDPVFYLETSRHALRHPKLDELWVRRPSGELRPAPAFLDSVHSRRLTHILITAYDFEPPAMPVLDLEGTGLIAVFRNESALILETGEPVPAYRSVAGN